MSLFTNEFEQQAIERIQKFARIADKMGFDVCVGFSGGKDSQVVYHLCQRSGIKFKAYFNHSFESPVTLKFIREFYPEVIWRRDHNFGFIENIWKNHDGMLPTVQIAYCCQDYKHNSKYIDECSIIGVRRAESHSRSKRTTFTVKNKTTLKKNQAMFHEYFHEQCSSVGTTGIIQLMPIIDWNDTEVCDYIKKYELPINPEYNTGKKRVGCMICPKADMVGNAATLIQYPKLIDALIRAREKSDHQERLNWIITSDNKDFSNDKCQYICRWLNHSFMPFTKKQEALYLQVKAAYDNLHKNNQ